jgi:hypothetical protein
MTERRDEPEQSEEDNEQPHNSDQDTDDTLEAETYEFTNDTSQEGVIELSERESPTNNGDEGDDGDDDTSDDSLEPEYVEKGDDEAKSIERR